MVKTPITVAKGDGIGPEIMDATLFILEKFEAQIAPEFIEIGEKVYLSGNTSGIGNEAWESLRRTKVFLKAPITTPQGGGYKSLNVTTRKTLGLYANVRPCVSYAPFVKTKHPKLDLVIIRENEEDLYAGIEHQQTPEVVQCLKLISRPGCEKIVRFAFEYALKNNRKKVTCFTKDNIMKLTDGLFHKVFDEIAQEYPKIQNEHWIIDIGMAKIADSPEMFDVVVMPNLYGDIASDVAAQITGSVGLAGSANIGEGYAMFEAIHGSAPSRAGKDLVNPSALLLGSVMMLVHIGQPETASLIHNAWLKTIEDGIKTYDISKGEASVGTEEFAEQVTKRFGQKPNTLRIANYSDKDTQKVIKYIPKKKNPKRELNGVDIFIYDPDKSALELGEMLDSLYIESESKFKLKMISNRGAKVYPNGLPETFCTDHWRCRFLKLDSGKILFRDIRELLAQIEEKNLDWIKLENLYLFDDQRVYSLGQGE